MRSETFVVSSTESVLTTRAIVLLGNSVLTDVHATWPWAHAQQTMGMIMIKKCIEGRVRPHTLKLWGFV